MFCSFQDRLGPLPSGGIPTTPITGFNTAVSAAVQAVAQAQAQQQQRDALAVSTQAGGPAITTSSMTGGTLSVIPSTTAFFQATQFQNSQQHTPPTTPLSVSTVSSHEPLFTISDHFVNGTGSGSNPFTTVGLNGCTNSLTTIHGRKLNENSLVVSKRLFLKINHNLQLNCEILYQLNVETEEWV